MNIGELTEHRRARLEKLADQLGGKAALGRALGFKDGAYIGQMIKGSRAITEKFIDSIEKQLPRYAGWFSPPASIQITYPPNANEPIADYQLTPETAQHHVMQLGKILVDIDSIRRNAIAGLLSSLAQTPEEAESIAAHVAALLSSPPAQKKA